MAPILVQHVRGLQQQLQLRPKRRLRLRLRPKMSQGRKMRKRRKRKKGQKKGALVSLSPWSLITTPIRFGVLVSLGLELKLLLQKKLRLFGTMEPWGTVGALG